MTSNVAARAALLQPARWHLTSSAASSMYIAIDGAEADALRRDAALRRDLEVLLRRFAALLRGVDTLVFVRHDPAVAFGQLSADRAGAMIWQWSAEPSAGDAR